MAATARAPLLRPIFSERWPVGQRPARVVDASGRRRRTAGEAAEAVGLSSEAGAPHGDSRQLLSDRSENHASRSSPDSGQLSLRENLAPSGPSPSTAASLTIRSVSPL